MYVSAAASAGLAVLLQDGPAPQIQRAADVGRQAWAPNTAGTVSGLEKVHFHLSHSYFWKQCMQHLQHRTCVLEHQSCLGYSCKFQCTFALQEQLPQHTLLSSETHMPSALKTTLTRNKCMISDLTESIQLQLVLCLVCLQ